MKLNVEIEFSHMDSHGRIDKELEKRIVEVIATKVSNVLLKKQSESMSAAAAKIVKAKIEYFVDNFLEQPVTIKEGWNKTKEYSSIYDMVEENISELYTSKLNSTGTCKEDPFLKNINSHVTNTVTEMLKKTHAKAQNYANKAAQDAIKNNQLIQLLQKAAHSD